jgi:hypothetical protein
MQPCLAACISFLPESGCPNPCPFLFLPLVTDHWSLLRSSLPVTAAKLLIPAAQRLYTLPATRFFLSLPRSLRKEQGYGNAHKQ